MEGQVKCVWKLLGLISALLIIVVGLLLLSNNYGGDIYAQGAWDFVANQSEDEWWQEAVFYQIYPPSFLDTNGDGTGDLQGIIAKLDYLESLGVNALWLSLAEKQSSDANLAKSINAPQNGLSGLGNTADFDQLLQEAEKRKMRLITDLGIMESKNGVVTLDQTLNFSVGEGLHQVAPQSQELILQFNWEVTKLRHGFLGKWSNRPWSPTRLKRLINKQQLNENNRNWQALYFGNQDLPRLVSHFGNDSTYRQESAKLFATLQFTLKGTPFIYQGDEIGMTNPAFDTIEAYRDGETLAFYQKAITEERWSKRQALEAIRGASKDNARTPMQWDASENAGFSSGRPWIDMNANWLNINVATAAQEEDSILRYYQKLIRLRRSNAALQYGAFTPLKNTGANLYLYLRELGPERFLVLLNLQGEGEQITLPEDLQVSRGKLLLSNYVQPSRLENNSQKLKLRPYEALVYQL